MAKYIVTDEHGYVRCIDGDIHFHVGAVIRRGSQGSLLCYDSPLLAVALNDGVYGYQCHRLFEVDGHYVFHDGLLGGARELTVLREVEVPVISDIALARWAIAIAMWQLGPADEDDQQGWDGYGAWQQWATQWLADNGRRASEAYRRSMSWAAYRQYMLELKSAYVPYMSAEVPELVELSTTAAYNACTDRDVARYAAQTACLAAGHAEEDVDFDGPAFARHLDALLQQAVSEEESLKKAKRESLS